MRHKPKSWLWPANYLGARPKSVYKKVCDINEEDREKKGER